MLLDADADVNGGVEDGMSPLFAAIYRNEQDLEFVRFLVNAGADVNAARSDGKTPLILSVLQGKSPDLIQVLLEAGADVDNTEGWGNSPLMLASGSTNPHMRDVIHLLLTFGADVGIRNNDGETAWDYIRKNETLALSDVYNRIKALSISDE